MAKADAEYFTELWTEIVNDHETLDQQMQSSLDRQIKELDAIELAILRIGVYELSKRSDIPYRHNIRSCSSRR